MRARLLIALLFAAGAWAQQPAQQPPPPPDPPEEDQAEAPKQYSFNPLQAENEVKVGDYYFKKRAFKAAAGRFTEATHWNPNFAEAYLRLGESEEKLKDSAAAKQAYSKYLELAPDAKNADSIRKKIGQKLTSTR